MIKYYNFNEIFHFIDCRGQSPNKKSKGIPLLTAKNVKKGFIDIEPREYLAEEQYPNWIKRGTPKAGDLLFTTEAPLGNVAILPKYEKVVVAQRVICLSPKKECDTHYYKWYMLGDRFQNELLKRATGSTAKGIRSKELAKIQIPLPPLPTQRRIAAILDEADRLRQLNRQLIEKYNQLSQSLFLDMFGDPVVNPKGWEKMLLGELNKITSGSTPSRKVEGNFIGNIPWVKTGEVNGTVIQVTSEHISSNALNNSSCKLYPSGSIIIAMYGQGKTRGQVGILGIDATTNQACAVIPPSSKMNYAFLLCLLKLLYEDIRELGRGGNQPNLNVGLIKKYSVINPPIHLQNQFATHIQAIEAQKAQAQQSLAKSEELFQSLLQKAFNGQLGEPISESVLK